MTGVIPGPPRKRRDPGIHEMARQTTVLRKTSVFEPGLWITGSRRYRAGPVMTAVDVDAGIESIEVSTSIPNERTA
jgi:hypothetical protein